MTETVFTAVPARMRLHAAPETAPEVGDSGATGWENGVQAAGFLNPADWVAEHATPGHRNLRVLTDDGVSLAVRDIGPRSASHTVVFLHGFCLTWISWKHHIDYLTRRYGSSVRVISYDHRGHGRSGQAPMATYRIDRLAQDLAQVLAAAQVEGPVTLVGHSMGGMSALAYMSLPASKRPVEPTGLVLAATAAGRLCERGLGRLLGTPATAALFGLVEHAPEHAVRAMVGPVCAALGRLRRGASAATAAALAVSALTNTSVSTAVGFLPSLRVYDQYGGLGAIQARTVVVSGGVDPLTPPAHGRDLAAGIPGAEYVPLPAAGHMLPQEAPHVLNAAIRHAMGIETSAGGAVCRPRTAAGAVS